MGGDFGPRVTVPAVQAALSRHRELQVVLCGNGPQLLPLLDRFPSGLRQRIRLIHASQVVAMDELPASALRHKRDSSMRLALAEVASGVPGCVSAGNTGALVALGRHLLGTLPGVARPAICSRLPTRLGYSYLLDSGANIDTSSEQLWQFALMGRALCAALDGERQPRLALLNIGSEPTKGDARVRSAHERMAVTPGLNYTGFIEADAMFRGGADVVVCDGFAGNVALKAAEGSAALVSFLVRRELGSSLWARWLGLLALPALRRIRAVVDPEQYNGACLLGLRGLVVKSHGGAGAAGFSQALELALNAATTGMAARVESEFSTLSHFNQEHE